MRPPAWASFFEAAHWGHFLSLVADDLRGRGLGPTVDGDGGVVRLADGRCFGLSNLAQMCHRERWDRWPALIAHHFGVALRATGAADTGPLDFEPSRASCKLRLWRREALPSPNACHWEIADDLVAALTLDLPDLLMTVNEQDAASWPIARADLWNLALANLRADGLLEAPAFDIEGARLHVLEGDRSFFAASHVLFLEDYVGPSPHGCVVAMPRRHTLLWSRIVDLQVVAVIPSMLDLTQRMSHEGPGSISPFLYWWRPGLQLLRLPSQIVGTTVEFHPPEPFLRMLNGLPRRA